MSVRDAADSGDAQPGTCHSHAFIKSTSVIREIHSFSLMFLMIIYSFPDARAKILEQKPQS